MKKFFEIFDLRPRLLLTLAAAIALLRIGCNKKGSLSEALIHRILELQPRMRRTHIDPRVGSAYDPLHESFGTFSLVVSLEVVEHVYSPREYAKCVYKLLSPSKYAPISTPYHGYFKNLALAVTGKMDKHFTALWDHGHIKFWSAQALAQLLTEAGLTVAGIDRVGRIPQLAKTMLVVARRCR